MYKLIAIDMDGTLLNSEKIITDQNKQAITQARQQGITVVLASGRPTEGMHGSLEALGMNTEQDYVLSFNAGRIQNLGTSEILRELLITGKDAKALAQFAEVHGCNYHAFSKEHGLITPKTSKYTEHEAIINGVAITEMDFSQLEDDHPIVKVMLVDPPEILEPLIAALTNELTETYSVVRSAPFFLEFCHPESNKGSGVKALAEHLNIAQSEVMCIGDAGNDHKMIEFAGMGVAMKNADDYTQSLADHVTESNEDSGVAIAIERFALAN